MLKNSIRFCLFGWAACLAIGAAMETARSDDGGWLPHLKSAADFTRLSGKVAGSNFIKFVYDQKAPGKPSYFQNTQKYPLHELFLRAEIPEFRSLTTDGLDQLALSDDPAVKRLSLGAVYSSETFQHPDFSSAGCVAFTLSYRGEAPVREITELAAMLRERAPLFGGRVVFLFASPADFLKYGAKLKAEKVASFPFAKFVANPAPGRGAVYHVAKSYGYLRKLSRKELEAGDYGSRDILVVAEPPLDIGPVSGVVSLSPQVPNSHVILRTIAQNIPNAFVPNADGSEMFRRNFGKMVELESFAGGTVSLQGEQELGKLRLEKLAATYFKARVPKLPPLQSDLEEKHFYDFTESRDGVTAPSVKAYGAKGTNFAILDQALRHAGTDRTYFNGGFLIPMSFYAAHIRQVLTPKVCAKAKKSCESDGYPECAVPEKICLEMSEPSRPLSDFLTEIAKASMAKRLQADAPLRKSVLGFARAAVEKMPLEATFLANLMRTLEKRFTVHQRIRFRSSTNAEDLPGLNGAGLYTSKSGCLGDSGEDDADGSKCTTPLERVRVRAMIDRLHALDAGKYAGAIEEMKDDLKKTAPVEKAVRKVFASLWNEKAYLSREYNGISHLKVFMGILVHPAFVNESANGVVIVDASESGRTNLTVSAQVDDVSITNPLLPFVPDHFAFARNARGQVSEPKFILHSNLTSNQSSVLNGRQLQVLAEQLLIASDALHTAHRLPNTVRYDFEFMLSEKGRILIKQGRPLGAPNEVTSIVERD